MAEAAGSLLDGRARQRLLTELAGEARTRDGSSVRLRLAGTSDEQWLLRLQQVPQTRRYARNPSVPTAEEHARWMARTLVDQDTFLLLIEADGECIGSLRLDRLNDENPSFEVSIASVRDCTVAASDRLRYPLRAAWRPPPYSRRKSLRQMSPLKDCSRVPDSEM